MTADEKKKLKLRIGEEKVQVLKDIKNLTEASKPIPPENAIGRISRMDAINNKSVHEAALRTAKAKLAKLEHVILKIDKTDFRECARCGDTIPIARLMSMPESNRCVNCAQ